MTAETQLAERNSNNRLRGARAEVRTDTVHTKQYEPYRPLGSQDVPTALKDSLEKDGWHLHWIRVTLDDKVDTKNLADAANKGYEPVDVKDIPENILRQLQIDDVGGFKGLIVSKDTALFKIPQERYEEIRAYYRDIADTQLKGATDNIRQNAAIHGQEVKLYDESESKVATGKNARQVVSQEDSNTDKDE